MTSKNRDTEKRLIQESLAGDQLAFRTLYEQLSPKMYTVALRYMNSDHDAQDVLQDAFIRIYRKLSSFRFAGSFEGWCRRIVVHTAIEHLRKSKSAQFGDIEDVQEGVDPKSLSNLQLADLMKAIAALPDGYRTVFNMYVIEGFSHKEIAEQLEISESTSKTQLFKARNQLQKVIKAQK